MYRLICADMDGTLLNDKKEISKRTLYDISEASKKGVKFVVATGRVFESACYFGDIIGVDMPIIASNGAYICDKDMKSPIFSSQLTREEYMLIYNILKKYDINPHFYGTDTIYSGKLEFSSKMYMDFNKKMTPKRRINIEIVTDWDKFFLSNHVVIKSMVIGSNADKIKAAREELERMDRFHIVSSMRDSFEIMKKGTSKGRAVEKICSIYGIDKKDVIALGDSENDISMIEYAGLGVAMGNGEEILKHRADYITTDNNSDGVAEVIERFVLN